MGTLESITLNDVRVTGIGETPGQGTPAIGVVAGLKYFRKFNKNGVIRPAHIEMTITRNHSYYDNAGNTVDSSDTMKLEAWNSDNDDGTGKGIADYFAKWYSVGKLFSLINARLRMYKRRVYNSNGTVVNNVDGTPILVPATSVIINSIRQMSLHGDSAKTIGREIANYNAGMTQKSFFSRPANWDNPAHADNAIWKSIIAFRKAAKYDGTDYYGNAKVCMVSGATPADGFPVQTTPIGNTAATVTPDAQGAGNANVLASLMAILTPEQQALVIAQQAAQNTAQQTAQATNVNTETPF